MTPLAVVRELLRDPPTQGVNAFGEPMVHMTVEAYESCLDTLAAALVPHTHQLDHETSDGPDETGAIVVVGVCACGAVVSVERDSVL